VTSCTLWHRPLIGLRGQILEGNGGNRRRVGIDHGGLALHRTPEIVVKRYGTRELQRHIEKSITDSLNFLEQAGSLARSTRLIRQDLEALHAMLAAQHLDQRIGIGDGSGLVADHHDDMMGRLRERRDAVAQSRRGIHHQDFDPVIEIAERADDSGVLRLRQIRHPLHAGRGRHDLQAMRSGDDGILQRAFALDHMAHVKPRVKPQNDVDVGQPQVGIEQHDLSALRGDRYREVGGHRGLEGDPALWDAETLRDDLRDLDVEALMAYTEGAHKEWEKRQHAASGDREKAERALNVTIEKISRIVDAMTDPEMPLAPLKEKYKALELERAGHEEKVRMAEADGGSKAAMILHPAVIQNFRKNLEVMHSALTNTKLTDAEVAPFRVAFGNVFDRVVVHKTGKRKPVEVTPYARVSAIMAETNLPRMRAPKEALEEQGLTNMFLATHGTLEQLGW